MRLDFTQSQKEEGINKIEVEDVIFTADYIEGEQKNWIMYGSAVIEGEVYNEFTIEFETVEMPTSDDIMHIMELEWDWYDFLF